MRNTVIPFAGAFALLSVLELTAGPRIERDLLTCTGGRQHGGSYSNACAVGELTDGLPAQGESVTTLAGSLDTVVSEQGTDSDGDGVPDALDVDNDNDGVDDAVELEGLLFTPVTPTDPNRNDTDGDGTSDADEAIAGTDPTDPSALFEISAIRRDGDAVAVQWVGREGLAYSVLASSSADEQSQWQPVTNLVIQSGGTGAWCVAVGACVDPAPSTNSVRFYRIRVER